MFGINKNGTKHKVGIIMPAFFPASRITHESVSVTADGVKTYGTLLSDLFTLTDVAKFTPFTKIIFYDTNSGYQTVYTARLLTSSSGYFYYVGILGTNVVTLEVLLGSSPYYVINNNGSYTDRTSTVPTSGVILKLVY